MRLLLLVMVLALGVDAYTYSGHYTQATINGISQGLQRLTSNISTDTSEQPAPTRRVPDPDSPTS